MRLISLHFADECTTLHEGISYKFIRNVAREIPAALADRLIRTGEFIEIINDDSLQTVADSIPTSAPQPMIIRKKRRCKNCPE